MRYLIWAGLALVIVGAVAVYWGASLSLSQPASVVVAIKAPSVEASTQNAQTTRKAPSGSGPIHVYKGQTWRPTGSKPTAEPELAPAGAYGPPPAVDPPEVIQIQKIDPQIIDAMREFLKENRPKLDLDPIPAEEIGPAEVVMNVLETPLARTSLSEESEPHPWMPYCSPDHDVIDIWMPYADEPETFTDSGYLREAPICEESTRASQSDLAPRMPRVNEEEQEAPTTKSRIELAPISDDPRRGSTVPNALPRGVKYEDLELLPGLFEERAFFYSAF